MQPRPCVGARPNIARRSHPLVGIVVALCLLGLAASPASAAPPPAAPQGGFTPANAYPSQQTLTPQQQKWLSQKEAAVAKWVQSDGAHQTKTNGIQLNCVSSPSIGPNTICNWITVSLGGQYTIEPTDQPNWCGPGAATAVAMHWDPNGVAYNHTPYTGRADPNWGGYSTTYYNQQGWMAWFAQGLGVQPYPNTAANTGGMAWGLNTALNTGFYLSTGVGANEAVLFSHVTFDIGSS